MFFAASCVTFVSILVSVSQYFRYVPLASPSTSTGKVSLSTSVHISVSIFLVFTATFPASYPSGCCFFDHVLGHLYHLWKLRIQCVYLRWLLPPNDWTIELEFTNDGSLGAADLTPTHTREAAHKCYLALDNHSLWVEQRPRITITWDIVPPSPLRLRIRESNHRHPGCELSSPKIYTQILSSPPTVV